MVLFVYKNKHNSAMNMTSYEYITYFPVFHHFFFPSMCAIKNTYFSFGLWGLLSTVSCVSPLLILLHLCLHEYSELNKKLYVVTLTFCIEYKQTAVHPMNLWDLQFVFGQASLPQRRCSSEQTLLWSSASLAVSLSLDVLSGKPGRCFLVRSRITHNLSAMHCGLQLLHQYIANVGLINFTSSLIILLSRTFLSAVGVQ